MRDENRTSTSSAPNPSLALIDRQRSHMLLVLSQPKADAGDAFARWFDTWLTGLEGSDHIVNARHYRQHEVDITAGRHAPIPYDYLTIIDLSLDGGHEAEPAIRAIAERHASAGCAMAPATWLYYPAGDNVGQPNADAAMLTIAYANPITGMERAFREFYATRHVRHALHIPALISGQYYERAQFQRPGSMQPIFEAVALYGQIGEPETIVEAFASLPPGTLDFPMLDKARGRFSECTYRRLG